MKLKRQLSQNQDPDLKATLLMSITKFVKCVILVEIYYAVKPAL